MAFLNGDLVGPSFFGGSSTACGKSGCGMLFELTPKSSGGEWSAKVLHSFTDADEDPSAVSVSNGSLYGAAGAGTGSLVKGSVFQLTF